MIAVNPCPFCGWHDVEFDEIHRGCFAVVCPDCETIGPVVRHSDARIGQERCAEKWNARTGPAELPTVGCGEARTASLATDDTPNPPTPQDWAAILAELHQLRADAAEHYARLEQMWRRYQEQLQQVVDGPERSALIQNVNQQADTIRRLQAENFDLAAGLCLVDSGLGHDEHGHQYCRLALEAIAANPAGCGNAGTASLAIDEIRQVSPAQAPEEQ